MLSPADSSLDARDQRRMDVVFLSEGCTCFVAVANLSGLLKVELSATFAPICGFLGVGLGGIEAVLFARDRKNLGVRFVAHVLWVETALAAA